MLSVEDWAEIRRLHRAEQMPVKGIARVMGVSRNTVRAAIASDRPPRYQRPRKGSIVDAFEPRIRELLKAYPAMPATVIAERIGWDRSVRVLRDRVAECARRTCRRIRRAGRRMRRVRSPSAISGSRRSWCRRAAGRCAAAQLPVLTMVCAYSRWLMAVLIPSRAAADLFAGWWQLIAGLGAVPRVLVWDGEGAIGRWRAGRPELTAELPGVPRHAGRESGGLPARGSRGQGDDRAGP